MSWSCVSPNQLVNDFLVVRRPIEVAIIVEKMFATSMYSKCIYQDPFVYWLDSKDSVISTIILFAIVYYGELFFLYFKRALVFNSQDLECEFWIIITGYSTLCFQILVKHSTSRIKYSSLKNLENWN